MSNNGINSDLISGYIKTQVFLSVQGILLKKNPNGQLDVIKSIKV